MSKGIIRNRKLHADQDVFSQNAWDDFEFTDEMLEEAERKIEQQREEAKALATDIDTVETTVNQKWDEFYQVHADKFFKDRRWIFSEFPELLPCLEQTSQPCRLLEVGCGVGNAIVHIINSNRNHRLHVYCVDVSPRAIETLKQRDFYLNNSEMITAFSADVHKDFDSLVTKEVKKSSLDYITLIFVLSALKPDVMRYVVRSLASLLKPHGMILFRDYARYDLTQLRFKGTSYLSENYYKRSDGTTSYFFEREQVDDLFTGAGLQEVELQTDNRLLVNRSKSLKMCRCWIQAKYMKPSES